MGVCCGVHVLFVNRPAGKKKGTLGSIAPATQGHKARSGGRWREERAGACGGNSICGRSYECMGTMFSAMALSATQRRGWRGRRRRGSGVEVGGGGWQGWGDASLCGRITVTAGWKRRPRRRLLEF